MSEDTKQEVAPSLSIRSAPRLVKQFNKKVLALILGGAALLVLSSFAFALNAPSHIVDNTPRELYSTSNNATAEGLADLPATYADIEPVYPELGPALPGDLGKPILAAQQGGRLDDLLEGASSAADADAQAAEARAIAARHRDLFFTLNNSGQGNLGQQFNQSQQLQATGVSATDPFDVIDRLVATDPLFVQNDQEGKRNFLEEDTDDAIYNPHLLQTPVSPWQVMSGSVIPATLITAINSDLPGQVVAQVTEPVYDTVTGNTLLIPQGTRVIGRYDSAIAFVQSRALIVWNRLIMPDGSSIRIDNLPAVDGRGNAGLKDRVNSHALRIFSAAALSSLISIGVELGDDDDGRITRALRDAAQDGAQTVGQQVVQRQLNVQPTITIRRGWRLRILVHQDIILRPYGDQ